MATVQSRPRRATIRVNGQTINAEPNETILQAALREGIAFPNSCRAGACGTCKCKVKVGKVKEATETAYLLSADEIDEGFVLACQSVPQGDEQVEVDFASASSRGVGGVVVAHEKVAHDPIRSDHFATRGATATGALASSGNVLNDGSEDASSYAGAFDYLKYFGFHAIGLVAAIGILGGGLVATIGLLTVLVLYMAGDAFLGDDASAPKFRHPKILTAQLWFALPLLTLIVFASVWSVSAGDPLGFGAWVQGWSGYDVFAARAATGVGHRISIFVLTGLMIGMIGTITAHELTHRTWDPVSMWIGRWLLAFSFDTNFAIEHVYGHHRYVSTAEDPATAPRGRNVYFHIVASTFKGNVSAWRIEVDRLRKKGLSVFSWHNAVIRGQLMSVALLVTAFAMGGFVGAAFFAVCALWGKALLEIVNYMEHYGMVRDPAAPVQPRHSWNTNRRVSSWTMFNLTRHSHHHAQGEVPYQDLKPYPDAPTMINGYLTTILVAMIPPLWHKLMTPKVLEWDREYATPQERELAAHANRKSRIPALQRLTATVE